MLATWFFGESLPQIFILTFIGLILIGLGFLFAFNSISRFIKAKTGVVPFSESTTLITEGFYKYTRNPMYVGMNSFLLGLLIILNNPLNLIFLIIFFFIVRNLFVIKEEIQMEETFGEEYLSYKAKVRRWL
jgi:protein-S-isoprenylcysteine O-methyltransferase Ste14|tara:strand:- start:12552 stop:12944 length:393 start_codon:yes stop_codon:yes gene_type:complete